MNIQEDSRVLPNSLNGSTEGDCKEDPCHMRLADLYAPQGVDLGESDSLSYWYDRVK